MRLLLLLVLLALTLGVAAGLLLHDEGGYVLLRLHGWTLETSILGFVVALTAVVLAGVMIFKLLAMVLRLPTLVRRTLDRRRQERAEASFHAGLRKLLEGQWRRAEIELIRRAADHQQAELNYLLAARAAHAQNAGDRRDHYLALAQRQGEDAARPAAIVSAELKLESGELSTARSALRALHAAQPRHPRVIALLAEVLAQTGDWEELRSLLARTARLRALPAERESELMTRALMELMNGAVREARLDLLKQIWDRGSSELRSRLDLRRAYARALARLNAHAEAAAQVSAVLRETWDPELVLLFGDLQAGDPLSQLAAIEQWLQDHGEQPELLLVAGRACLRNRLWGKARSYLEGALRLRPTAATYLELARLCEHTQKPEEAVRFYRQGLEQAAEAAA